MARIAERGFEPIAEVIEQEVDQATPLVEDWYDLAPPIDLAFPEPVCLSLDLAQLTFEDLGLTAIDFGIDPFDFDGIPLAEVDLCLNGVRFDPTSAEVDDLVTGGLAPFVSFDTRIDRIRVDVVTGPLIANFDVDLFASVNIDTIAFQTQLAGFTAGCQGEVSMGSAELGFALDLEASGSTVDVSQRNTQTSAINGLQAGGNGLCSIFSVLNVPIINHALTSHLEEAVESFVKDTTPVATALDDALDELEIEQPMTIGDAELQLTAPFSLVDEDRKGVSIHLDPSWDVVVPSPESVLVTPAPDLYFVDNVVLGKTDLTPDLGLEYDFAPALTAAFMTDALHAAYEAGVFHVKDMPVTSESLRLCTIPGLAPCGSPPAQRPLTTGMVAPVMPALALYPPTTPLVISGGPELPRWSW